MSSSTPSSFEINNNLPTAQQILGVAIFDAQGLPREYFLTAQHSETDWLQVTLQSLGLQQLFKFEMELPSLNHAIIRTNAGNIAIVPSTEGFIAILLKRAVPQDSPTIDQAWIEWACNFVETVVRTDPNFRAV